MVEVVMVMVVVVVKAEGSEEWTVLPSDVFDL